jgi:hypothetical protein
MAIGCLLPVTALAAIFLFEIKISTVAIYAIFLLCPAMHLWMMKDHMGRSPAEHEAVTTTSTLLEKVEGK